MAKQSMSLSFKNATIDVENDLITEIPKKDTTYFYKLSDIIKQWDKIEGISIKFDKDDEVTSTEEGNE